MGKKKTAAEEIAPRKHGKEKVRFSGPGRVEPFKPGEKDFDPSPPKPRPGHGKA